jgi:hypothetical protein
MYSEVAMMWMLMGIWLGLVTSWLMWTSRD